MGDWTDWFLVGPDDVDRLASVEHPETLWPHLNLPGVTCFEIDVLTKLLDGTSYSPQPVYCQGEDGPLILRIPDWLIRTLAQLDRHQLSDLGRDWHQLCWWDSMAKTPDQALETLERLHEFVIQAYRGRQSIFQLASLF